MKLRKRMLPDDALLKPQRLPSGYCCILYEEAYLTRKKLAEVEALERLRNQHQFEKKVKREQKDLQLRRMVLSQQSRIGRKFARQTATFSCHVAAVDKYGGINIYLMAKTPGINAVSGSRIPRAKRGEQKNLRDGLLIL
ncbi:unnamed protein product [Notodromas monacha]|uniref:Uncharacterized protein n=1 Tax=Notodromas monacha TaxID=399045 RepID=A0A7R9GDW8_9CRUS|nr:unnamed protein product [Notodromas monacha]CAG0917301.1 unnamed protein product [Notodromas monacha]